MVWFRVGCCERCGGVGSRGERGSLTSPWATYPPPPQWYGPPTPPHHPHLGDDAGNAGDAVQYRVSPAASVPDSPFHPVSQHPRTSRNILP